MERLTADELRSRLRFDYETVMLMSCPLMKVEAYRNLDDLLVQRNKITSADDSHLAVHYRVEYNFNTLVGPGRYSKSTTVRFDLFADSDYPQNQPPCFVIESELPWSPHFHPTLSICTGPIWEKADGTMLLGELMVHVAKLLNFDEPPSDEIDYGYQPDAARYWVNELGRRPISKLVYPQLPPRIREPKPDTSPVSVFVKKEIIRSEGPAAGTTSITFRTPTPAVTETPLIKFR